MSVISSITPAVTGLAIRPLARRDLFPLLQLLRQACLPPRRTEALEAGLHSIAAVGCAALVRNRLVGFGLAVAIERPNETEGPAPGRVSGFFQKLLGRCQKSPLYLPLLDTALLPDYQNPDFEKALVHRLAEELQRRADCIQAIVPESNLQAQLALREGGYRATQVVRGYYGDEDGYRMVREPG